MASVQTPPAHSAFFERLASYPLVEKSLNGTIAYYDNNVRHSQYRVLSGGAALGENVGRRVTGIAAQVVPYVPKVVSNSLGKLDALAESGLGKIETNYPIVKAQPDELRKKAAKYYETKVKPPVDGIIESVVAKEKAVVESKILGGIIKRTDSVVDYWLPAMEGESVGKEAGEGEDEQEKEHENTSASNGPSSEKPQEQNGNVSKAKHVALKVSKRVSNRIKRVRSRSVDSVGAYVSEVKHQVLSEYERAVDEERLDREGSSEGKCENNSLNNGSAKGSNESENQTHSKESTRNSSSKSSSNSKAMVARQMVAARVLTKTLYRTVFHYTDLTYSEMRETLGRWLRSARESRQSSQEEGSETTQEKPAQAKSSGSWLEWMFDSRIFRLPLAILQQGHGKGQQEKSYL